MRKSVCILAGLIFIAAAASAIAVGKITVDPNGPGARAVNTTAPEIDARLEHKVTYDARRQTVSSILADLAKLTGVTLRAGYSDADWQVRDRRMNVFAKDTSLRSLMDSISHVMKFKWSRREAGGTWTYRLYMDRTTLLGAERQRLIEEERMRQLEDKQRERVLDDLTRANAMSDEELEKLKDNDPMLYVEARCGWAVLMPDLFSHVPGAKEAWSAGEMLTLNGADLPADAQQAVVKALGVMGEFLSKVIGPEQAPPKEAFNDLSKVSISINSARKALGFRGDTYIGDITLYWPGGADQTAFINPDSPESAKVGRDYVRILDGEPVGEQKQAEMNSGHLQAVEGQKTDFGEPIIEHPDDPDLSIKVKLKPMGNTFADLLRAVAKASGYAVVSDSFATVYRGFDPLNSDVSLKDVLNGISSRYRYNWDKHGGVIEFRDRDWFRRRASQVPEAWLEPWRKALKSTGTLTLDELGRMSLLDDDQARENLYSDDVLGASGLRDVLTQNGDLLRAYASLDDKQQAAAFTDAGFDLATVSPPQWATIAKMFRSKPLLDASPDTGIVLTCRQAPAAKQFRYDVAATSGDQSAKWEFTTPEYELSRVIRALPLAGEEKRALELFDEARRTGLFDADSWFHLGRLLYEAQRYRDALEAYGRVIAPAQKKPLLLFDAFVWKGHVLDLMGRREDAISAYKDALKIDIGDQGLGDLYDVVIDRKWVEARLKTPFERK